MATYAPVSSSARSSSRPTAAAASTAAAAAAARRRGQDTPIRAATGSVVTFVWGSCVWTVAVFWHDAVELRGFSVLVVLFAMSAVLFLVSIVTAACVPPGRSPDDWPWNPRAPLPPGRAAGTSTTVEVQRLARKIVYCPHCERYKPDRTHHCNRCQQCVPVYDHHCPFIGQCVGARNRKFVELTLFYACWMTMWLVCIQIYLVAAFGFPGGLQSAANALGVVVAVLGCVALLAPPTALIPFAVHRARLLVQGRTHIEWVIQRRESARRARGSGSGPPLGDVAAGESRAGGAGGEQGEQKSPSSPSQWYANIARTMGGRSVCWLLPFDCSRCETCSTSGETDNAAGERPAGGDAGDTGGAGGVGGAGSASGEGSGVGSGRGSGTRGDSQQGGDGEDEEQTMLNTALHSGTGQSRSGYSPVSSTPDNRPDDTHSGDGADHSNGSGDTNGANGIANTARC